LNKKNVRAAIGWIGLIWFAPVIGIALYYLFGINRIKRRARARLEEFDPLDPPSTTTSPERQTDNSTLKDSRRNLAPLASLTKKVSQLPLLEGNKIDLLDRTDDAYESMIEAIRNAEESLSLCTYIFTGSGIGERFVEELIQADRRGVEIRVIVDDVGARYSRPQVTRKLSQAGIPNERFMQTWLPWKFRYFNLRNHRKIMVVDGKLGFTGGLNISNQYSSGHVDEPGLDAHFRLEGPVVAHLQYAFADDWLFCHDENLTDEHWFPTLPPKGTVPARGLADGPDTEQNRIRQVLLGAISCANEDTRLVSPYFLPDDELVSALKTASLKDVRVDVIIPRINTSRMVQWGSAAAIQELLENDCNVYFSEPPFDHAKLLTVDGYWTFFGSANWDARSLKLNFEFNVEAYDEELAGTVNERIENQKRQSRSISADEFRNRSTLRKLRDNAFRLLSPYL
jgi:cardiolipin synthase